LRHATNINVETQYFVSPGKVPFTKNADPQTSILKSAYFYISEWLTKLIKRVV